MSNNHLTGEGINSITQSINLETLKLGNNFIKSIDNLKPLTKLDSIINLDLSANVVCDRADYREIIFELLPNLEVLDGIDKNGNE